MNALDAILTRRTVHEFNTDPVQQEWVESALQAALRAPNHKLTNPWRFYQLGPSSRETIVDIALEAKREFRELTEKDVAAISSKIGTAPVLIMVSQVLSSDLTRRKEDYASVSCAIQNFSLAMWSYGVSSKWSTGPFVTHRRTYDLLGIQPEKEELVAGVFAGYPVVIPDPNRAPLSDVFRRLP